jgi:clumping factor B
LIQYDQTAAALDAAQKKTALAVAEDNVRQQEKELERIKKLKPSEEAPAEPDYPDYPDDPDVPDDPDAPDTPVSTLAEVSALTQAAAGSGSAEDPYQFSCTGATVVKQAVLEQLKNTGGVCGV